jgi:hypothetical protein
MDGRDVLCVDCKDGQSVLTMEMEVYADSCTDGRQNRWRHFEVSLYIGCGISRVVAKSIWVEAYIASLKERFGSLIARS